MCVAEIVRTFSELGSAYKTIHFPKEVRGDPEGL